MSAKTLKRFKKRYLLIFNFRMIWYPVLIWILAILLSGIVMLPWYYLFLPVSMMLLIYLYFKTSEVTVEKGLFNAIWWFTVIGILDFFEIIGPYFGNVAFYFSDFRNFLKYPLVLLMPVIYCLVLENINLKKSAGKRDFDLQNLFKKTQVQSI